MTRQLSPDQKVGSEEIQGREEPRDSEEVLRDNYVSVQISILLVNLVNNSYSRLQCD